MERVVVALIAADRAGIDLDFRTAASIDLAGRDLLDAVKTSVTPKVIDCPNPASGKTEVAAVAKDGIQVLAKARVTVRTNIARLVGGAGEETIIARVGEGIVSTIGSKRRPTRTCSRTPTTSPRWSWPAGSTRARPSRSSRSTSPTWTSGQHRRAPAGRPGRGRQARRPGELAEKRRAMAVAAEQEFKRQASMENRAKVVLAEAEVPRAMAEALKTGNLGVMDLYRLRNIEADTQMRGSIAARRPRAGRRTCPG